MPCSGQALENGTCLGRYAVGRRRRIRAMEAPRIVTTLPPAPPRSDVRGAAGRALAGVVLVAGVAGIGGLATLVIWASLQPGLVVRVNTTGPVALGVMASFTLLFVAWVSAARRKRLVLFLRRFGQRSANEALSGAMYRSLGAVARLVVLDDSVFRPIAIPVRQRMLIVLSTLPAAAALAGVLALGIGVRGAVVLRGETVRITQQGFINIGPRASSFVDETTYTGAPALLQLPQALPLWAAIAGLAWLTWRGVAAGWESRRRVDDEADLKHTLRRMAWLTRRISAPKPLGTVATVVSSSDGMWQEVVAALAARASVIVLDVSYPTAPILWELAHCLDHHRERLLLVLNEDDHWRTDGTVIDEPGLADLASRTLLGGILAYTPRDAARRTRFEADLRAFVSAAVDPP